MAISPEAQAEVQILRQKCRDGTATTQDMRRAIELLREDRVRAAAVSSKSRAAKAKPVVDSDSLLSELDNL